MKRLVIGAIGALLLTIIIELGIGFLLKVRNKKDLLNIMFANIFTNPIVNMVSIAVLYKYGYRDYYYAMVILELFAFASEGFIYSKVLNYKKINPYLLSLILNSTSYLTGILINTII